MAYEPTVWQNLTGEALGPTNLNKLEQGVADAHSAIAALEAGGGGGGGAARAVRHDTSNGYDYTGTAPAGTAESAPSWTITRITLTATPPLSEVATGAAWADRVTEVYS